jgi:hypothetical protein
MSKRARLVHFARAAAHRAMYDDLTEENRSFGNHEQKDTEGDPVSNALENPTVQEIAGPVASAIQQGYNAGDTNNPPKGSPAEQSLILGDPNPASNQDQSEAPRASADPKYVVLPSGPNVPAPYDWTKTPIAGWSGVDSMRK